MHFLEFAPFPSLFAFASAFAKQKVPLRALRFCQRVSFLLLALSRARTPVVLRARSEPRSRRVPYKRERPFMKKLISLKKVGSWKLVKFIHFCTKKPPS
jgi:hypothetical protein